MCAGVHPGCVLISSCPSLDTEQHKGSPGDAGAGGGPRLDSPHAPLFLRGQLALSADPLSAGPGRDDAAAAVGDHAQPGHARPEAADSPGRGGRQPALLPAHGRQGGAAASPHPGSWCSALSRRSRHLEGARVSNQTPVTIPCCKLAPRRIFTQAGILGGTVSGRW